MKWYRKFAFWILRGATIGVVGVLGIWASQIYFLGSARGSLGFAIIVGLTAGGLFGGLWHGHRRRLCPECGRNMGKPLLGNSKTRATLKNRLDIRGGIEIVRTEGGIEREVYTGERFFLCQPCDKEFRPTALDIAEGLASKQSEEPAATPKLTDAQRAARESQVTNEARRT